MFDGMILLWGEDNSSNYIYMPEFMEINMLYHQKNANLLLPDCEHVTQHWCSYISNDHPEGQTY